ncbi:MAG: MBL fold metallo-hydrolase [Methanosarcinales archaeon]|nr:MBL fold metallo-hydrolase [Methanosarcinales archaeon]
MVGYLADHCPFCGAPKTKFITSEECSARYHVIEIPITKNVSRLNSSPKLGLEHAAYRIKSDDRTFWMDCPSCFDTTLAPMDDILFTHFHFLGASNQYREYFSSKVWIHQADSRFEICRGFPFDNTFLQSFEEGGIEAHHIDGHTPGFVCYFFEDVFLMCDYVFYGKKGMRFNPFGPVSETIEGGFHIKELLDGRDISKVCAVDYVMDFNDWILGFDGLLASVKN